MHVLVRAVALLSFGSLALVGCGDDEASDGNGGAGGAAVGGSSSGGSAQGGAGVVVTDVSVSGTVVALFSGMPVADSTTVSVTGIAPAPSVTTSGSEFTIEGVLPHSVFNILAGAPPSYRTTYNFATAVEESDLTNVLAEVVPEWLLADMETEFGVNPQPGTGIVLARLVNPQGQPLAGVPDDAFLINGQAPVEGPYFLDAAQVPDAGLTSSSASGYAVFYNLPNGLATITADPSSGLTVIAASAPTGATTVTLMELTVQNGGLMLPTNVSFANDVVPIFEARGCDNCHAGNAPGADLGNLALNGSNNKIYGELTEEISPTHNKPRVDVTNPEMSLVLTMPSAEQPPDAHPNITFASSADPDYLTLLGWITEGALEN